VLVTFLYVYIYTDTVFWRCLSGQQLSPHAALKRLNAHFQSKAIEEVFSGDGVSTSRYTVLLLDEVDYLSTGDSNVLYSFFDWAMQVSSQLVLISISNVIDLPERFIKK
jgi:Cdc6-like AAA superfamily ATPase